MTLGSGKTIKYGENVTYYWDTTTENQKKPYYETSRGITGNLSYTHSKFVYHDGTSWQESILPTTLPTQRQKICTLIQTCYGYDGDEDTTLINTDEAYKMLFGSSDENYYWLASSTVMLGSHGADFEIVRVRDGLVDGCTFVNSDSSMNYDSAGIRAVVTLSPNVTLVGTAASGYEIK